MMVVNNYRVLYFEPFVYAQHYKIVCSYMEITTIDNLSSLEFGYHLV